MAKTHIKSLQDNNYFGECDLPSDNEGRLVITINKVSSEMVTGDGNKKSRKPVMFFKEHRKGLVLNSTNIKRLISLLKTAYIEDMVGHKVELYREKNVKAFGTFMDCVRVSKTLPVAKKLPELTKTHPRYAGVVSALESGEADMSMIESTFHLSEKMKKELNSKIK